MWANLMEDFRRAQQLRWAGARPMTKNFASDPTVREPPAALSPMQADIWKDFIAGRSLILHGPNTEARRIAYLRPSVIHALNQPRTPGVMDGKPYVLIVVPTRQHAYAVDQSLQTLTIGGTTPIPMVLHGTKFEDDPQFNNVPIAIATPGSLDKLAALKWTEAVSLLVVDQVDRFGGNWLLLRRNLWDFRPDRQTVAVTTAWNAPNRRLAREVCLVADPTILNT